MLEVTHREWWIDLTFGMTDGWWRFTDRELRRDYPLLSVADWRPLLAEAGFDAVSVVEAGAPSLNSIIICRAAERAHESEPVLVVTAPGGTRLPLAAALSPADACSDFGRGHRRHCRAGRVAALVAYRACGGARRAGV